MPAAAPDPIERLRTARLVLQAPRVELGSAVADYLRRNRAHFAPWDPPSSPQVYGAAFQRAAQADAARAFTEGSAYRYWLSPHDDARRVIGSVHFSNVVRGAQHGAALGYGLDSEAVGAGLMTEALTQAIATVFSPRINLHRIQASWLPHNLRSGAVLQRLGFHDEGLARDYLFIDGHWRDHRIFALLNPAFIVPAEWPQWIAARELEAPPR
ncbi:MAG: GNAT family N-acetyltransferase [Burkholderiaceae bacterium]